MKRMKKWKTKRGTVTGSDGNRDFGKLKRQNQLPFLLLESKIPPALMPEGKKEKFLLVNEDNLGGNHFAVTVKDDIERIYAIPIATR